MESYRAHFKGIRVIGDKSTKNEVDQAQLQTVAEELSRSIAKLLGVAEVPVSCCDTPSHAGNAENGHTLIVSVDQSLPIGLEGYKITRDTKTRGLLLEAASPSGALYGTFRLLGYLQRAEEIPVEEESSPAMAHRLSNPSSLILTLTQRDHDRMWDLWDELSGSVTRGFSGRSFKPTPKP